MVNRISPAILVGGSVSTFAQRIAAMVHEHEREALRTPFFLIDSIVDLSDIRPRGLPIDNRAIDQMMTEIIDFSRFWGEPSIYEGVRYQKPKPDWKGMLPHERSGPHRHIDRIKAQGLPPRHPTKGFRRAHKRFRKTNRV